MNRTKAPDTPEPDEIEPALRIDSWRDAGGALWSAITGRTAVWALGPPIRMIVYPRAMRIGIWTLLALGFYIAFRVTQLVDLARLLQAKENLR